MAAPAHTRRGEETRALILETALALFREHGYGDTTMRTIAQHAGVALGNAYYILARAYIAAELNRLSGASIPADVLDAFNEAKALFMAETPAEIAALKGKERSEILGWASLLDDYNNGLVGPGHCPEE